MVSFKKIIGFNTELKKWSTMDWVFFYLVVPLILTCVFILPDNVKSSFILDLKDPNLFSVFFNNYTHSRPAHYASSVIVYILSVFSLFNTETEKKRMYFSSVVFFLVFPFIPSIFMLKYLDFLPPVQGFSGIGSAFLGYLVYAVYSFLRKNYEFIKPSFFSFLVIFNFTILSILNKFTLAQKSIIVLIMLVLTYVERKNILDLYQDLVIKFREIRQRSFFEFGYKVFTLALTTVLVLSLPVILPETVVKEGNVVNTISHYFGWAFGLIIPFLYARIFP